MAGRAQWQFWISTHTESTRGKALGHKIGVAVNTQENNARCAARPLQTFYGLNSSRMGMDISVMMMSGFNRMASSINAWPLPTLPTTSNSGSRGVPPSRENAGDHPPVVLVPSSVSHSMQWRAWRSWSAPSPPLRRRVAAPAAGSSVGAKVIHKRIPRLLSTMAAGCEYDKEEEKEATKTRIV